jgi:hypothetical protein
MDAYVALARHFQTGVVVNADAPAGAMSTPATVATTSTNLRDMHLPSFWRHQGIPFPCYANQCVMPIG